MARQEALQPVGWCPGWGGLRTGERWGGWWSVGGWSVGRGWWVLSSLWSAAHHLNTTTHEQRTHAPLQQPPCTPGCPSPSAPVGRPPALALCRAACPLLPPSLGRPLTLPSLGLLPPASLPPPLLPTRGLPAAARQAAGGGGSQGGSVPGDTERHLPCARDPPGPLRCGCCLLHPAPACGRGCLSGRCSCARPTRAPSPMRLPTHPGSDAPTSPSGAARGFPAPARVSVFPVALACMDNGSHHQWRPCVADFRGPAGILDPSTDGFPVLLTFVGLQASWTS